MSIGQMARAGLRSCRTRSSLPIGRTRSTTYCWCALPSVESDNWNHGCRPEQEAAMGSGVTHRSSAAGCSICSSQGDGSSIWPVTWGSATRRSMSGGGRSGSTGAGPGPDIRRVRRARGSQAAHPRARGRARDPPAGLRAPGGAQRPKRRFAAIEVMAAESHAILLACRVLAVSESGYYAQHARPPHVPPHVRPQDARRWDERDRPDDAGGLAFTDDGLAVRRVGGR